MKEARLTEDEDDDVWVNEDGDKEEPGVIVESGAETSEDKIDDNEDCKMLPAVATLDEALEALRRIDAIDEAIGEDTSS